MITLSGSMSRPTARPEPASGFAIAALAASGIAVVALVAAAALLGRSVSPVTWYVARASGMTLYLLLWGAAITGLGMTTGLIDRWGGRGVIFSLHAFTTQLSYAFLTLHLLSLAADPTVRFGPAALLVPFAAGVREPWTGLGVLAGELTILIGVSVALKPLIGQPAWRALHWLTFPLYALALLHGLGAGTDSRTPWALALYLVTGAAVVLFSLYRLLRGGQRRSSPPARTPALTTRSAHAHPDH